MKLNLMIRLIPPPKATREEIKNGCGVCYRGKLLGEIFAFNIYHNNKIFNDNQVETDFDIPIHPVIIKNKDAIKRYYLKREIQFLRKQQKS